jgi:hypothetical protein
MRDYLQQCERVYSEAAAAFRAAADQLNVGLDTRIDVAYHWRVSMHPLYQRLRELDWDTLRS